MSIPLVLTNGLGNGTFSTTIPLLVLEGYSIGEEVITVTYTAAGYSAKAGPERRSAKILAERRSAKIGPERRGGKIQK